MTSPVATLPFAHRSASIARQADTILDRSARLLARALSSRCPGGPGEAVALHGDGASLFNSAPAPHRVGVFFG